MFKPRSIIACVRAKEGFQQIESQTLGYVAQHCLISASENDVSQMHCHYTEQDLYIYIYYMIYYLVAGS